MIYHEIRNKYYKGLEGKVNIGDGKIKKPLPNKRKSK